MASQTVQTVTKPAAAPPPKPAQKAGGRRQVQWIWEARTKQGEVKKGEMEASDQNAVEARLKSLGLTPSKVRRKGLLDANVALPGLGGVTGKDLLVFTRQFATMIDAGLPLVQCLDILGGQTDNASFRKVILAIKGKVESGSTF